MMRAAVLIATCLAFASFAGVPGTARAAAPAAQAFPDVEIPYQKFVLPNGLTLLVHEDHKAPIVAVNTYYHVGSKDERPGRTGFAHLFEHLMFNGSENYNDEYFRALQPAGATKLNGTTYFDRTNYFQNVPPSALDLTLWMESDRMGHLLGVIDQKKLDEQRGVVQNEKRQGENRPYGKVRELLASHAYPAGHPYSWTTIGSMADLDAATLDDVKEWFRTWYGAGNVVLTIAGDVKADEVKAKVEKYYGHIPGGPVLQRPQQWIAKMTGEKRVTLQDRVPQARIYKVWNIPGFSTREAALLDLAAGVLGSGKNSRLYKRLVYTDQQATAVSAYVGAFELGGQFTIVADVKPGGDVAAVERAMDEELARLLREGPTAQELARQKTTAYAAFVRAAERVDGFGGKSTILAEGEVYAGGADFYKRQLGWWRDATGADVHGVAKQWLADGVLVITVTPVQDYRASAPAADRSKPPATGAPPSLTLPALQRATLSNGLKVVLAERHETPVVQMRLMVDGGTAADSTARPGTTGVVMNMLDEGTTTRDALQLAARAEELGAQIATGAGADTALVSLSALSARLPESLELFADVVTNPTFPEAELRRIRQQLVAQIRQQKSDPNGIVARLAPSLVYGADHPYAAASRVSEVDVMAMDPATLRAFHRRWLRPDNATLLVVGDTTLAQLRPLLEQRFAAWKAPADPLPRVAVGAVAAQAKPRVFLVDRPGAEQSTIVAAHVAQTRAEPDFERLQAINTVLGGSFLSRLNLNLREDKHWSYGVRSRLSEAKGPGLFGIEAPVQSDRTAESVQEIRKELREILTTRRPTAAEIAEAKSTLVLTLPGNNETVAELTGSYANLLTFGLPDDYWNAYVGKVTALTAADFAAAADRLVKPDGLTWLIVGDLAKIEAGVRALGLGDVEVIDADGKRLR